MKETTSGPKKPTQKKTGASARGRASSAGRKAPVKKSTSSIKRAPRKKSVQDQRKAFYQELLGLSMIGLGVFALISMLSGSVGILGESIKEALLAILGSLAYVFPLFLLLMGAALILRKPGLFSNKKTYGVLLFGLTTALLLSLNRMESVHQEGFMVTLRNLMNIEDTSHGGILGLMVAVPLYRLLGPLGTYIVAGMLYVVSLVLFFNTTLYDFLRQVNAQRRSAATTVEVQMTKHKEKKSRVRAQEEDEKQKLEEKLALLKIMEGKEEQESTNSPFIHLDVSEEALVETLDKEDALSKEVTVEGAGFIRGDERAGEILMHHEEELDKEVQETTGAKPQEKPMVSSEVTSTLPEEPIHGEQMKVEELVRPSYEFPEIALLKQNIQGMLDHEDRNEIMENAKKLEETLQSFGVEARVMHVSKGPSVTRYELQPKAGVKVSRIVNLSDDIALALAARGVRIEAPIPGKAAVGIEIPNKETTPVYLREVIEDPKFQKNAMKISVALGKDISGDAMIGDLAKMPHVLIAGATGSGKSVCINSLIISILYKYEPDEVRLLMVDPKVVELNVYNGIPHLLIPVVTDPKKAAGALNWAVNEMTRRYQAFAEYGVRNLEGFNELAKKNKDLEHLPYIVIIVDELADLMMVSANEVEDYIARLAQMARAAGMHLVIATQRPSVDVITGVIKANIPSRISFAVSSAIDSRTILDSGGAEKLLGKGDMLYYPVGEQKPKRIQGAFISEEEVEAIVSRIKVHKDKLSYDEEILEHIEKGRADQEADEEGDELYQEAVRVVVENQQASTSFLQRKMRIGYNRAARIMEELEERGVISPRDGAKPRQILLSETYLKED